MGLCVSIFQASKKLVDSDLETGLKSANEDLKRGLKVADAEHIKTGLLAKSLIERLVSHNFEDIIKAADTPIDQSSKENLFAQLQSGVSTGLTKESELYCFMLFSKGLSLNWVDDERYWSWRIFEDPEEGKLEMAELLKVCALEVNGSLDPAILSPKTMYEIVYIFKLYEEAVGWETPVTLKADGEEIQKVSLLTKPRGQWIEVVAGEFYTDPTRKKDISFSLCENGGNWKSGLLMKGVVLRPKKRE